MNSDKGFIIDLIKSIFYIFFVGIVYYYGTYFWASLFITDERIRKNIATIGVLTIPIELILIVTSIFWPWDPNFMSWQIITIHAIFNLIGLIFNFIRSIISSIIPGDEDLTISSIILFVIILFSLFLYF